MNEILNRELENRVRERTRELETANQELQRQVSERRQAEDALRANEADFRASFYSSAVGQAQVDPGTGRYLRVNPKFCDITGYTEAELLEMTFRDLTHPDDRPADDLAHERMVRGEIPEVRREKRYLRKDGRTVWININASLIRDERGRPLRTLAVVIDTTERQRAVEALRVSEASLRQSESRFAKAFWSNPAPMCITTIAEGRFIEVNERYCRIFDFTREELIGHTSVELGLWAASHERGAVMENLQASGMVRDYWAHFRRRNGDLIEALINMELTDFPGVQERLAISMFADITERMRAEKRLRASEERLRLITNLVPHGIFAKDATGRYLFVNRALADGCGFTVEEVLQKSDFELVSDPAQASAYRADDLEVIQSGVAKFIPEELNTNPSGRTRIFQTTKIPFAVPETGEPAVLGVSVDITDRKRAEEEVQRLNAGLEDRVAKRTAELETANRELEAFSYSVSHDLRAPLRSMDGFSQALLEDFAPHLPEGAQRWLRTIRRSAQQMGMLIDDLLAFSRLSRAPLRKREVSIEDLVRDVLEEMQAQNAGRQLEVKLGALPPCEGDPGLLRQVWINLLSNAFKYTRKREPAVIEIAFGPDAKAAAGAYRVSDNGAGFDPRYSDKLFGVFQRLHRAEDFEGTGVGLAIVQRIIQRHGGRIWFEAAVDRGATFHFTLQEEHHP